MYTAGGCGVWGSMSMSRGAPVAQTVFFVVFFGLTFLTIAHYG